VTGPLPYAEPERPSDRIALHGIRAFGRHGVLPEERVRGQEFTVDAVLELDTRPAAAADDLAATVSYADLAADLAGIVGGEPVALIETLAQRLADRCLADSRVRATEVTVHKPHAPVTVALDDVTVTIRRSRA
jgi:dihydroneopterin aldolase